MNVSPRRCKNSSLSLPTPMMRIKTFPLQEIETKILTLITLFLASFLFPLFTGLLTSTSVSQAKWRGNKLLCVKKRRTKSPLRTTRTTLTWGGRAAVEPWKWYNFEESSLATHQEPLKCSDISGQWYRCGNLS